MGLGPQSSQAFTEHGEPRRRAWWPLVAMGGAAGAAGLVRDVPAAGAIVLLPACAALLFFLLSNPTAWIPLFIALSLLLPPLPLRIGADEIPVHPASLVFAAACLVGWVRIREWRIDRNSLSFTSLALLAALAASLPWAFFYSGAVVGAQSVLRWLLLFQGFVVLAWLAWGPVPEGWDDRWLLRTMVAAALLSSAFAIADFFYQFPATVRFSQQYIYLGDAPHRRAQGVFYDASALGDFCAMMLALILSLGGKARRALRLPGWLLWLSAPPLAIALVLSFSRGPVVNLAVALVALICLRRKPGLSVRGVMGGLALAAAVALCLWLAAPETAARYVLRLEFSLSQFFSYPNEVLSRRLDAWGFLLRFLSEKPSILLLGMGYKSLPYSAYFHTPVVADNMYLSLLVETGVPGLLALFLFCGALLACGYGLSRHSDAGIAGLGSFLFAFWCGQMVQMLSGDILTYWRVTPVYFAILGVALRRSRG